MRRLPPETGWLLWALLVAAIMTAACASTSVEEKSPMQPVKLITDFVTVEDAETVSLIIRSNQPLTYSAVKQQEPLGIYFQFPETALNRPDSVILPPPNAVIRAIRLNASGGREPEARFFLELLLDVPYMVVPEHHDLRIVFAQPGASLPPPEKQRIRMPELAQAPVAHFQAQQTATIVKQVSVTPSAERVVIRVTADGPVKDVRAFTIEEQAKIVFDLVGLRSVYRGEQKIPVQSAWVSQVRHFGHPDKVRLVVETDSAHLNAYAVDTVSDGLVVTVGKQPASASATSRLVRLQPVGAVPEGHR
jgi:hypothetical protein